MYSKYENNPRHIDPFYKPNSDFSSCATNAESSFIHKTLNQQELNANALQTNTKHQSFYTTPTIKDWNNVQSHQASYLSACHHGSRMVLLDVDAFVPLLRCCRFQRQRAPTHQATALPTKLICR